MLCDLLSGELLASSLLCTHSRHYYNNGGNSKGLVHLDRYDDGLNEWVETQANVYKIAANAEKNEAPSRLW